MDNKKTFVENPVSLDISRSRFDLSHVWSGTFNAGICVPVFAYSDVLPGSTYKLGADIVIRSTTPNAPTMDQLYADLMYFFVPHKMVLGRETMSTATTDGIHSFEAFIGAQDSLLNMPLPGNSTLPKVVLYQSRTASNFIGSFADYIGINGLGLTGNITITPFEALSYAKVWNDYFRDPNTMNPISYSINNGLVEFYGGATGLNGSAIVNTVASGSQLVQPACRFHGYFGSALPWPQRNSTAVTLPLGSTAPVKAQIDGSGGSITIPDTLTIHPATGASGPYDKFYFDWINGNSTVNGTFYTDLSQATAASVNALRLSVATQRWYEALSRVGNRLQNVTQLFNVTPHDLTSDTPEYLGGKHIKLNITQVANTAGTTYSTATQQSIGSTGAYCLTSDSGYYFTKSFDTWGTIIAILVIRPHESFSQGIHRRFFRDDRLKYYWPQFANLGEQAILEKEIYAQGTAVDDTVFGYQEAWSEYRMLPDLNTSLTRCGQSLAYWNYGNNFASAPTLGGYISGAELYKNIDQTLQVASTASGFQFMAQVGHKIDAVLPMPTYSIPGLMDHH